MKNLGAFLFLGVVGLASLAGSARADLVIDDFSNTAAAWPVVRTTLGTTTTTETGLTGVVGGRRVSNLTATAASPNDAVRMAVLPGSPGAMDYSSDTAANGSVELIYDGNGTLNVDLTQGGANSFVLINFIAYDFPAMQALPVTMTVSDGTNTRSVTRNYTQAGAGGLGFAFSDPGFAGVNFTTIRSISFLFDPVGSSDFRVGPIRAVPEPSPAVLALLGVAGAFGARKLRSRRS